MGGAVAGRRRKARARERRAENETSPSLRLLARLAARADDGLLRGIAEADHGIDVERHLDALRELRDSLTLSAVPLWHPGEVLELERWSEPPRPGPDPAGALRRAHLARAFACAALLAAAADERVGYAPDGEHRTLVRLLDSVIALDDPALEADALAFVRRRVDGGLDDPEELTFFLLAQLLLTVRAPGAAPDLPAVCLLARRTAAEEVRVRNALRARPTPPPWVDDASWPIGLAVFDQSARTWRRLGRDLEDAARTELTGQARVEVEALARRLRD